MKEAMRLLELEKRISTFDEVSLGYNEEEMMREASKCLNCKTKPCTLGCPVNIDIPAFISHLKNKNINEAYKTILKQNSLPGICGRVCPQENQCEGKCVRGIKGESVAIGRLERYASDHANLNEEENIENNGFKVAAVGSGPASLAFASQAIKDGFEVTIYEALHATGGVLRYGIPEFRLPKSIVDKEIEGLVKKGLIIKTNYVIGKTKTLEDLKNEYDAIFIASGAGLPRFMNIKGENLAGVFSANEFLTRVNLMKGYLKESDTPLDIGKKVVIVGGGNVAMDAARCARRLGAEVRLVYRRSKEEMPARKEEIEHAIEEGIVFCTLTNPYEIMGDENFHVKKIKCREMILGDKDETGRRSFIEKENSNVEYEVDSVIMAIGNFPNPIIRNSTNIIEFTKKGTILVDENNETSCERIYAGGDIVTGAATVISAMGAGKKAALKMKEKLFKN